MAARRIWTRYQSCILKISVYTYLPCQIRLVVADAKQDNTMFTNRSEQINGLHHFYVRMPQSGSQTIINVFNEKVGNYRDGEDSSFTICGIEHGNKYNGVEVLPLECKIAVRDISNTVIRQFVEFAQKVSFNAGFCTPGEYRSSPNGFIIKIIEGMIKTKNAEGKLVDISTPMRVSEDDGLIEASEAQVSMMTVPMRMALFLHEFSHFWMNEKMDSEIEADIRALHLYLSLGYPFVEARDAFIETFAGNKTAENELRAQIIEVYIQEFQQTNYMYYD